MHWKRQQYTISTDPSLLDVEVIHGFLREAYWSPGIPRDVVERAIRGSMAFGVYDGERQVGFARVITDRATYAYIADVFVIESHRGRGLSRWLMECIMEHPDLQDLRRWSLVTRDAHGLYEKFGFARTARPERHMEIVKLNPYGAPQ